jgi:FlaG protein
VDARPIAPGSPHDAEASTMIGGSRLSGRTDDRRGSRFAARRPIKQGDMEIGHLNFQDVSRTQVRRPERKDAPGFANKLEQVQAERAVASSHIPVTPPPDVVAEVQRAAARADELHKANRELHFEKDHASGRIVVQVRDLSGNVLRTIPPSKALDVMAGAGL